MIVSRLMNAAAARIAIKLDVQPGGNRGIGMFALIQLGTFSMGIARGCTHAPFRCNQKAPFSDDDIAI
jgi:hypothetical protein